MKQVRYIGLKPSRADTLGGSGVVWHGNGDVQPVPDEAWEKLKQHPTVWELVTPAATEPPLAAASVSGGQQQPDMPADDLATMNVAQLREWAKANGKKIDGRLKDPDAIRALLTAE